MLNIWVLQKELIPQSINYKSYVLASILIKIIFVPIFERNTILKKINLEREPVN